MTRAQEYDVRLNGMIQAYRKCSIPEVRFTLARTIYDFQHNPPKLYTEPSVVDVTLDADIRRAIRDLERDDFNRLPFYHRAYIHLGRWLGIDQ